MKVPTVCPICGKQMHVQNVKCDHCGTVVQNDFELSVFDKLSTKQTEFALAFIESEGSIKEMEKRFDISYPTVKARLADIKRELGLSDKKSFGMNVLEDLRNGEIDVDSAVALIKGEKHD